MISILVNGDPRALPASATILALLTELRLGEQRVAVELNGAIVPRSRHDSVTLRDGDQVLIVQAIGGG